MEQISINSCTFISCATSIRFDIDILVKSPYQVYEVGMHSSHDNWKHVDRIKASYLQSMGGSDIFRLTIPAIKSDTDKKIKFALYFKSDRGEFWNNNYEKNFEIDIMGIEKMHTVQSVGGINITKHMTIN